MSGANDIPGHTHGNGVILQKLILEVNFQILSGIVWKQRKAQAAADRLLYSPAKKLTGNFGYLPG